MTWHIDEPIADAYLRRATDGVTSSSVDAHLATCADCQALLSSTVDPELDALLAEVWDRVDGVLDRPRMGVIERALLAVGCTDETARIVTSSARAQWSYLIAVTISVAMAITAAQSGRDAAFGLFLLLAPVGPLVATAGAFGQRADPLQPLLRTLPTSPWRMALIRTAASVVPAVVLTMVAVPVLNERGWLAVAWLLPSLALSTMALVLATWISIEPATLAVGAVWLATPMLLRPRAGQLIDAITGPFQVVAIVVVALGAVAVVARRTTFEYRVLG
jgi:hypothetical protein